eukprot:1483882-Rhodomonas_salina.2
MLGAGWAEVSGAGVQFALMEYKLGSAERGATLMEGVVSSYPKRVDLWSVFIDLQLKAGNLDGISFLCGLEPLALSDVLTCSRGMQGRGGCWRGQSRSSCARGRPSSSSSGGWSSRRRTAQRRQLPTSRTRPASGSRPTPRSRGLN